jgi:hypothetical protein
MQENSSKAEDLETWRDDMDGRQPLRCSYIWNRGDLSDPMERYRNDGM